MASYFKQASYKLFALKAIHLILSVVLFFLFFLIFRYGKIVMEDVGYRYNYYAAILYGVLIVFFSRAYNAYLLGYTRIRMLVFGQVLSQLISVILLYLMVWDLFILMDLLLLILV